MLGRVKPVLECNLDGLSVVAQVLHVVHDLVERFVIHIIGLHPLGDAVKVDMELKGGADLLVGVAGSRAGLPALAIHGGSDLGVVALGPVGNVKPGLAHCQVPSVLGSLRIDANAI